MSDVGNVIRKSLNALGEVDLSGIRLEEADPRLLDPTFGEIDEHVAMQPSAIAYYGSLLREARRNLDDLEAKYKRWQKRKYGEVKGLEAKATVQQVEAIYVSKNEEAIIQWEEAIMRLREEHDTLDVWYEAWRQKSYANREHVMILDNEWKSSSPTILEGGNEDSGKSFGKFEKKPNPEEKIDKVRRMIRNGRQQGG